METMLKLSEKRSDRKSKVKSEPTNVKKKRDWVAIVHKGCRVCMFRTFEGILAILGVTIISMVVGSLLIPNLTFSIAFKCWNHTEYRYLYSLCCVAHSVPVFSDTHNSRHILYSSQVYWMAS